MNLMRRRKKLWHEIYMSFMQYRSSREIYMKFRGNLFPNAYACSFHVLYPFWLHVPTTTMHALPPLYCKPSLPYALPQPGLLSGRRKRLDKDVDEDADDGCRRWPLERLRLRGTIASVCKTSEGKLTVR
jgi:hypothetical protein